MTTEERNAFLAAIASDPNDDTARLVYADRVQDDDNDEIAALIRRGVLCGCVPIPVPRDESSTKCGRCKDTGWVERCQHDGCRSGGDPCYMQPVGEAEERIDGYYCGTHAGHHGFCCACGQFWGGIDSFEATGLCDHCAEQIEWDEDEERDYESDFYGDDYEV